MSDIRRHAQALRSRNADNRRKAIHNLARSSHPKALKLLRWAARNDPDAELQILAQKAVAHVEKRQSAASTTQSRTSAPAPETPQKAKNASFVVPTEEDLARKRQAIDAPAPNQLNLIDVGFGTLMLVFAFILPVIAYQPFISVKAVPIQSGGTVGSYVETYRQQAGLGYASTVSGDFTIGTMANIIEGRSHVANFLLSSHERETFAEAGVELPRYTVNTADVAAYDLYGSIADYLSLGLLAYFVFAFVFLLGVAPPTRVAVIPKLILSFIPPSALWMLAALFSLTNLALVFVFTATASHAFIDVALAQLGLEAASYSLLTVLRGNYGFLGMIVTYLLMTGIAIGALSFRDPESNAEDTA